MSVNEIGALLFGVLVGWITHRTLRRSQTSGLSDIATVIGAVGGAAITSLFPTGSNVFGYYCIGLAVGFFLYLFAAMHPKAPTWLGTEPLPVGGADGRRGDYHGLPGSAGGGSDER